MDTTTILPGDAGYPDPLMTLAAAGALDPPALFLRGALPTAPGICVVGTRAPTDGARDFTRTLVRELAGAGFSLWSGGARGIDAEVHEAALDAGAPTVVVVGGGLGRLYPPEHGPLFSRVLDAGGALLARAPDEAPPTPPAFLRRNELLAALSVATVVIQAGLTSGARSTAAAARRLGRPLCVVPHAPWDDRGAGCALELARGGARPIVSAAEVLASLSAGLAPPPRRPPRPKRRRAAAEGAPEAQNKLFTELSPDERVVLAVLGTEPMHLDEIQERSNFPFPRLLAALLTLTLGTVVVEGPAGFYRQVNRP
ncbi:MAG: DNA-processing protein DprA [Byssovorax sp.]